MAITKAERTELRSIVRQQFKVLRAEIAQRKAELIAEAEQRVVERYRERDAAREAVMWKVAEVLEEAGRRLTDLVRPHGAKHGRDNQWAVDAPAEVSVEQPIIISMPTIHWRNEDKVQLHRAMVATIEAEVSGALLQLDRREADLLRTLSVGVLESAEAQSFLTSIPTVGELVPAARLAELEAELLPDEEG